MAKLSARGRKEVARLVKEWVSKTDPDTTYRKTVAFMTDNHVLVKLQYKLKNDKSFSTGNWTVAGKVKAGVTMDQAIAAYKVAGYVEA